MRKLKILNQAGDTIVEVLLAVIVVGLAVGLGYGVASRSLKSNRQSQERVEALKKIEGQIERLKKLAATDNGGPGGVFQASSYCIIDTPTQANKIVSPIDTPPALNLDSLSEDAYSDIDDSCIDGLYRMSITPDNPTPSTKQFQVRARWFSIGKNAKEETVVTYRIYPASP